MHFAVGEESDCGGVYRIKHLDNKLFSPLHKSIFFNSFPLANFNFKKVVEKVKPDIIHCHNIGTKISLGALRVAIENEIPCVVTIHDYWPICLNRSYLKQGFNYCNERSWNNCPSCKGQERLMERDRIGYAVYRMLAEFVRKGMRERQMLLQNDGLSLVAVSEYVRTKLIRFGYSPHKLSVLHNGIDIRRFHPSRVDSEKKIILFVGSSSANLSIKKGINHFVRIAEKVRKQRPDVKFVNIGGKGACTAAIKNTGRIPHEQIVDYFQQALLLCVPSLFPEPFPTVTLEAMACGIPVIAYAVGGLPEEIEDAKTGFLVEPGNIDMFVNRVILLLNDENLARCLGSEGRRRAVEYFNSDLMCAKYEQLYARIKSQK